MYGIIYLLTNAATGAKYVGQTIQGLEARWRGHISDAKDGASTRIASAIREYGQQAFIKFWKLVFCLPNWMIVKPITLTSTILYIRMGIMSGCLKVYFWGQGNLCLSYISSP